MWVPSNQLKDLRAKIRFLEERILPQDCNIETLSEFLFPTYQPGLQVSDLPLPAVMSQFLKINLSQYIYSLLSLFFSGEPWLMQIYFAYLLLHG